MINKIETIHMDFTGLKNSGEILSYIPTQLQNYHPDPSSLIFDYTPKGLVSFMIDDLENNKKNITHPLLIFRQIIRKDGYYIVFFKDRVLEVNINKSIILSVKESPISCFNYSLIPEKSIVISNIDNIPLVKEYYSGKITVLEKLYNKCKKDLFQQHKKKLLPIVIIIISLILLIIPSIIMERTYKKQLSINSEIKKSYFDILEDSKKQSAEDSKLTQKLEELSIIESQIPPNIYNLFYELQKYGDDFYVTDFNYSNGYLRINAVTPNSLKLIENLNTSKILNLKADSTTRKEGLEQVNISGEVL